MHIVLYYAPSACSLVPYVTLTEAGAEFETRPLNMRKRQQMSDEYLRINPKHKVPFLLVDGKPLSENVAIQIWIDRAFPGAQLLPRDEWLWLQCISVLSWCSSGIHPYLRNINSPSAVCGVPGSDASVTALAEDKVFESFAIAETMLNGKSYFFDHFTAADAHFFWCFRRGLELGRDQSRFVACTAHYERMKERESVQKLLAYEEAVRKEFARVA
jgi:glutathione S-transferase